MDENTKQIVASNLTIAYCANRPSAGKSEGFRRLTEMTEQTPHEPLNEEEIVEIYNRFLALLST